MWAAAKAVLGGKFTAQNTYVRKVGTSEISNIHFHLREVENEEHLSLEQVEKKKSLEMRAEVNELENN